MISRPHHLKKTSSMQSKCCDQHHMWLHGEIYEKLSFYCYSLQWITTTFYLIFFSFATRLFNPRLALLLSFDKHLLRFQSFQELFLFSAILVFMYNCFVFLISLVTLSFTCLRKFQLLSAWFFWLFLRSLSRAFIPFRILALNHFGWTLRFTLFCFKGRCSSIIPLKILYQVSTTSFGSSNAKAQSQGALCRDETNCSLLRLLMSW